MPIQWNVRISGKLVGTVTEDVCPSNHGDEMALNAALEKFHRKLRGDADIAVEPAEPLIRYRPHLTLYADSMMELAHFEDFESLVKHIRANPLTPDFKTQDLRVEHYGYDERAGWEAESYIVWLDGFGVLGYIDRLPDEHSNRLKQGQGLL